MKISRYSATQTLASTTKTRRKVRKHLNADGLIAQIRQYFQKIPDGRGANKQISLDDALMSAFAMFQL